MIQCKICRAPAYLEVELTILGSYGGRLFRCSACRFAFFNSPHWLAEAYSDVLSSLDTWAIHRNLLSADVVCGLVSKTPRIERVVDVGGGTGLMVRILRDRGIDAFWADKFCRNYFAQGFEAVGSFDLVTAFEVLEHTEEPLDWLEEVSRAYHPDYFLFSTEPSDAVKDFGLWNYVEPESGQHISFFSLESLRQLGTRLGFDFQWLGSNYGVLFRKPIDVDLIVQEIGGRFARTFRYWAENKVSDLCGCLSDQQHLRAWIGKTRTNHLNHSTQAHGSGNYAPRRDNSRHVHVCDPNLIQVGGHYYDQNRRIIAELQRRSISPHLYANCNSKIQAILGVTAIPLFSKESFFEPPGDSLVWPLEAFLENADLLLKDLRRIDNNTVRPNDVFYFPSTTQNQLLGIARWIEEILAAKRPQLVIMLRWLNHLMPAYASRANFQLIPLLYRYSIRRLLAIQPNTVLISDTEELASEYSAITGAQVFHVADCMGIPELKIERVQRACARPSVLYLGSATSLRGFHLLPEIVRQSEQLPFSPRFLIQAQTSTKEAEALITQLRNFPKERVSLIEGTLASQEYIELLKSADIVLLPYYPQHYKTSSSGVFTEAVSLAKVLIVSPGTVQASLAKKHKLGVLVAAEWSAEAFVAALHDALRDIENLSAKSKRVATAFGEAYSARAFWDQVFGMLESG